MSITLKTDNPEQGSVDSFAGFAAGESHDEPRIHGPFPARVKGSGADGRCFTVDTVIENLSARDCCVLLTERAEVGERLFVAARIDRAVVLLRAKVLRISLRADGMWGALARITRYRFVHRRRNF
ncbi:MAG TPA: hypothetical protein VJT09_18730 [Pyrinomonadaceae bacterium]|nr:hypothetical protein [Pyrinomonadaceae bacterium]